MSDHRFIPHLNDPSVNWIGPTANIKRVFTLEGMLVGSVSDEPTLEEIVRLIQNAYREGYTQACNDDLNSEHGWEI